MIKKNVSKVKTVKKVAKKKPSYKRRSDAYKNHEIMDRSYMIFDTFNTFISETEIVKQDKVARKLAEEIDTNLLALYQHFAKKCFSA
jgi:hypothetical protein